MFSSKKTSLLFLLTVFISLATFASLLFWTIAQWQTSSDQTSLEKTEEVAKNFYVLEKAKASETLNNIIKTRYLQRARNQPDLSRRIQRYIKSKEIIGAETTTSEGILLDNAGSPGVFNEKLLISRQGKKQIVRLEKVSPAVFINDLRSLTGQEFSLYRGEQILASTLPGINLPRNRSSLLKNETSLNLASLTLGDLELISGVYEKKVFVDNTAVIILALLLFFFLVLILMQIAMRRSGQRELRNILQNIERVSRGEKLEVNGQSSFKEVSLLYKAVGRMSEEVESLVSSLKRAKERLEGMIRKSGDVFAMGPSEEETLRVLLDLALSSTEAEAGLTQNNQNGEKYIHSTGQSLAPFLQVLKESERGGIIEKRVKEHFFLALPLFAFEKAIAGLALSKKEPFGEKEKETIRYLASQAQVALENSELHARLKQEAATDELTELANRRTMRQALEKELARSIRFDRPLSLLLLDIDNFKEINDTYGHPEGDLVIKEIGQTMQKTVRHIDLVARWGGDEFLILLPETGLSEAQRVAERIQQMIRNAGPSLDKRITASIGIATYPQDAKNSGDMVLVADQAMYRAKKSGKDCIKNIS